MMSAVRPGDIIGGRYRIDKVLGTTVASAVYSAIHVELDQRVAIKLMLEGMGTPTALKRFRREAKLMGRIQSEYVVRVIDFGTLSETTPYIVMEHLEGMDLQQLVRQGGPLDVPTACNYLLQACEGLASAHAVGIVHRDIKPSNLFLVPRPDGSSVVKIIDFGIAKLPQNVDPNDTFTRSDVLLGTPRYMSPEQTKGRHADARSDVWSLATMLQELITGKPVFKADSLPQLFVKIVNDAPTPLRQQLPTAPLALEQVISRALAKEPNERSTLTEFASGLAPFGGRGADDRAWRIEQLSKVRPSSESLSSVPEEDLPPPASSDVITNVIGHDPTPPARPSWEHTTKREAARHEQTATLSPVEPSPALAKRKGAVAIIGVGLLAAMSAIIATVSIVNHRHAAAVPQTAFVQSTNTPGTEARASTTTPTTQSSAVAPVATVSSATGSAIASMKGPPHAPPRIRTTQASAQPGTTDFTVHPE